MTSSARTSRALERDPNRRIKVGTSLALLLGLFIAMIGLAPSAYAHHSNIKVDSDVCDASGGYIVTATSRSWSTVASGDRVLNSNVQIDYRKAGGAWQLGVQSGAYVQTSPPGGTPSFTKSFVVPATAAPTIEVRARPVGQWKNTAGSSQNAGAGDARTVTYTLTSGDCGPDVSVTNVAQCATKDGVQGVNVTVTNDGKSAGDLDVPTMVGGAAGPTLHFTAVPGNGGTQTRFFAVPEDSTFKVGDGATQTNDCAQPDVSFTSVAECATEDGVQGVNVTVTNNGTQAGDLTVATEVAGQAGSLVFTDVAPNGGTQTRFLAVGEDVSYSVNGGSTDVNDCAQPNVSLTSVVECATKDGVQGVNVTVTNSGTQVGDLSVPTTVGGVGGSLEFTNVAPNGGTQTRFLPVGEDVAFVVGDTQGVNDCAEPDVNLTSVIECATEDGVQGVTVKVTNSGTQAGDLTLPTTVGGAAGPDLVFTDVQPNGGTQTKFLPVPEDSTFSVDGGETATNDCAQPNVALTSVEECATQDGVQGVIVTVTNGGTQAGDLTLPTTVGGAAGPDLVFTNVAPNGGTQQQFLAVGEDVSFSIADGETVVNDCVQSNVTLTSVAACATVDGVRGVNVTVTNNGGQAGGITLPTTVGGVAGPDLVFTDVAPGGGTQTKFLAVGEDVSYSVGDRAVAVNDCEGPPPIDVCPELPGNQPIGTDCDPPVDVCPEIPGDQPEGTDCDPPVDVCPEIPGDQPTGTDCNPPVDACPDVEGIQLTTELCSEVQPTVITPTPTPTPAPTQVAGVQLPRTGAESQALGLVGAGLLLLGAGLLLARRPETADIS